MPKFIYVPNVINIKDALIVTEADFLSWQIEQVFLLSYSSSLNLIKKKVIDTRFYKTKEEF
ncbi:MAG: hypothetical protein DYG96_03420 [Chlorobi bacterium CHB2]|nr:hypothetical protein [Chlorobi bacterium CHB2]